MVQINGLSIKDSQKQSYMSQWIRNKSCEICGRIEVGLVEMNVGKTKHYLCYPCMANFASDVLDYARMNLTDKVNEYGNTYFIDEKTKAQ